MGRAREVPLEAVVNALPISSMQALQHFEARPGCKPASMEPPRLSKPGLPGPPGNR